VAISPGDASGGAARTPTPRVPLTTENLPSPNHITQRVPSAARLRPVIHQDTMRPGHHEKPRSLPHTSSPMPKPRPSCAGRRRGAVRGPVGRGCPLPPACPCPHLVLGLIVGRLGGVLVDGVGHHWLRCGGHVGRGGVGGLLRGGGAGLLLLLRLGPRRLLHHVHHGDHLRLLLRLGGGRDTTAVRAELRGSARLAPRGLGPGPARLGGGQTLGRPLGGLGGVQMAPPGMCGPLTLPPRPLGGVPSARGAAPKLLGGAAPAPGLAPSGG